MFNIKNKLFKTEPIKRGRGRPPKIQSESHMPDYQGIKNRLTLSRSRVVIAVIIVVLAGGGLYFYQKNQANEKLLKTPDVVAKKETDKTIQKVSEHVVVPTGETPTVATVSDINKLKDQPFFANAQNGDKVLVYSKARRVILYRPSIDRIVDTTLLDVSNSSAQTSP